MTRLPEPYAAHHRILRRIEEYQRVTGLPMPRREVEGHYGAAMPQLLVRQGFIVWHLLPDTFSVRQEGGYA